MDKVWSWMQLGWRRGWRAVRAFPIPFYILSVAAIAMYSIVSLLPHFLFKTNAFDLGIFNQTAYQYAHLSQSENTIRHIPSLLGDHFELLLIPASLLTWVFGSYALLVVQLISLIIGGAGVYLMTRRATKDRWLALGGVALLYVSYGVLAALSFDFHNDVIAAMFIPWLYYLFSLRRWRLYYLALGLFLLSKETVALLGVFLGVAQALGAPRGDRKHGLITVAASLSSFIILMGFVVPWINHGRYDHWLYTKLGPNASAAIVYLMTHPVESLRLLFDDSEKLQTWRFVVYGTGLLALTRWRYTILLIPVLAQKLFSDIPETWGALYQYSIVIAPVIALAVPDMLAKLVRPWRYVGLVIMILINVWLSTQIRLPDGRFAKDYLAPEWYQTAGRNRTAMVAALDLIPPGASVSAQNTFVPHLTDRREVYLFPERANSQFVLVSRAIGTSATQIFPFGKSADLAAEIDDLERDPGYRQVYNQAGVILFERVGTTSRPDTHCSNLLVNQGWSGLICRTAP